VNIDDKKAAELGDGIQTLIKDLYPKLSGVDALAVIGVLSLHISRLQIAFDQLNRSLYVEKSTEGMFQ